MFDQQFDRDYQASRVLIARDLHRLLTKIEAAFERLSAIQYEAPWRTAKVRKCRDGQ